MLTWVLDKKIMELTGLTHDQLKMRRRRGFWECGVHYDKFEDGQYWYNLPAIQQWMDQQTKPKIGHHSRGKTRETKNTSRRGIAAR